jgi:hypothetical protein
MHRPPPTLLLALATLAAHAAPVVYVDHARGNDAWLGRRAAPGAPEGPVKTFARALRLLPEGGTLHLAATADPYREPVRISRGGTAEEPLVIAGHGAVIDLGTDIRAGPWRRDGAEWVYDSDLGRPLVDDARTPGAWQVAGLFLDGRPLAVRHRAKTGPLAPGDLRCDEQGRLRCVPFDRPPGEARAVLPALPAVSGVAISGASHVTVRDLTVRYAGNDGFNIHGACRAIRFERVRGFHCGDEGISSHEDSEVAVVDSEFAWCGSAAGGVADVNQCVTTYERCLSHHNRGQGFSLEGSRHRLTTCVAFANAGADLPKPRAGLTVEDCATLLDAPPTGPGGKALWDRALAILAGQHRLPPLLFAAEGAHRILRYDQGAVAWEYPAEMARDVWQLGNGNVLFCYNDQYQSSRHDNPSGVLEVTPDKRVVFHFRTTGQVWSCQRLANGQTLVGAASQGKLLLVDPGGQVAASIKLLSPGGHSCLRNARQLADGHFLVAEEGARAVREYDADGKLVQELKVGFPPYSAVRLPNGRTLACGAKEMVELDAEGRTVWSLPANEVAALGVRWLAGLQVLPDGHLFLSNAGGKVPFFELDSARKLVWQWPDAAPRVALGHGVQRLDVPGAPLR